MGISAMYAAATGMKALDVKLNVVANNLANINTTAFKRSRTNFEDLMYEIKREPGVTDANDNPAPHGIQVGLGVAVAGTQLDFQPGGIDPTGKKLDMVIEGDGFFQVQTFYNGQEVTAFTRAGNFVRNANGDIVLGNSTGPLLEPGINVPPDVPIGDIEIGQDGVISYRQDGVLQEAGQIELARFVNPQGLLQIGKNLYLDTEASGEPLTSMPQEDGAGSIRNSALEQSNVDPVRELVDLILTQRGFEMNSQSIQSADETMRVVTNLRR